MEELGSRPFQPQRPLEGDLVFGKAGKSVDESGKKVKEGRETWRLELRKGDNRFNLEVYSNENEIPDTGAVSPSFLSADNIGEDEIPGYVKVRFLTPEKNETVVFVKIEELVTRLHLSEETIKENAASGNLEKLIAQEMTYLPKAIDFNQKTKKAYFRVHKSGDKDELVSVVRKDHNPRKTEDFHEATGLSRRDLMKISKAAAIGIERYTKTIDPSTKLEFSFKVKESKVEQDQSGEKEADVKETQTVQRIKIFRTSQSVFINQGTFNIVSEIYDVTKARPVAIKIPVHREAEADALRNQTNLYRLNQAGGHRAIQKNPKMVTVLDESGQKGYIFTRFICDLYDKVAMEKKNPSQRDPQKVTIQYCLDLVGALHHMRDNNVIHGDIKGENICVGRNGQLTLIDFGGSLYIPAELDLSGENPVYIEIGTPSPDFTPFNELSDINNACRIANFALQLEFAYRKGEPTTFSKRQIPAIEGSLNEELSRITAEIDEETREGQLEILKNQQKSIAGLLDILQTIKKNKETYTPSHMDEDQAAILQEYRLATRQNYIEVRERLEIFDLGLVICDLMTGGYNPLYFPVQGKKTPFYDSVTIKTDSGKKEFPTVNDHYDFSYIKALLLKNGWSEEIADVLEEMLNPTPQFRYTYEDAWNAWNALAEKTK